MTNFRILGMISITLVVFYGCSSEAVLDDELQPFNLAVEETLQTETFDLVNDYRVETKDLNSLDINEIVYNKALELANYMAENKDLSHHNFTIRAKSLYAEINAVSVAENIARNYNEAGAAVDFWINSVAHQATILGDFTHTAVAVVSSSDGDIYYAQIFVKIP